MEVLGWIVAGCPDGVMAGATYKTTAVALQGRRLVEISRKGGTWRATATRAGRHYAERGVYPDGHWTEPKAKRSRSSIPWETQSEASPPPAANTRRQPPRSSALRPVEQMMADLSDAGGTLVVSSPTAGYWEGLASSATRHGKVPDGQLLEVERGASWEDRVLLLRDKPPWMTAVLAPVPVAEQLRKPHPVVARLRDDKDRLRMRPAVRGRALRILDALAQEAVARGHRVATPTPARGCSHPKGHLEITVITQGGDSHDQPDERPNRQGERGSEHPFTLILDELNDRVPHHPSVTELRAKERHSWTRIPTHDQVASGRLRIKVTGGWKVAQEAFADTKSVDLPSRLAAVLREIELRAEAAEQRRRQRVKEAAQRRHQWEQTRNRAVDQVREQHRAGVLLGQVEAWRQAQELDHYLTAMTAAIDCLSGEPQEQADAWLTWAKTYRQRLDPLAAPLLMPDPPTITAEMLAPFMRGLSPFGPR